MSKSPKWLVVLGYLVVTVILLMGRSLLSAWVPIPVWSYALFLPAYGLMVLVVSNWVLDKKTDLLSRRGLKFALAFLGLLYLFNHVYRINSGRYRWWKIFTNNLPQYELLLMLLPVAVLVWFYLKKSSFASKWQKSFSKVSWPFDSHLILTSLFSLSPLSVSYFKDAQIENLELGIYGDFFLQTPLFASLHFLAIYGLLTYLRKSYRDIRANRASFASSVGISLLLGFACNYLYQASMAGSSAYFGRYFFPGAIVFQIACLTLLNLLISMVFNRQVLAFFTILLINGGLIAANFLKFKYRSEPLTPNDFKWVGDIGMIVSFINPLAVVLFLCLVFGLLASYLYARKRFFVGPIETSLGKRLATVSSVLGLIFGMGYAVRHEVDHKIWSGIPILSQVNNWKNVDWKGYAFVARYRSLSYLWLQQLSKLSMQEPKGYSKSAIQDIVKKYSQLAKDINQERTNQIADQTVIYVLSESLANPNRLPSVHVSQNVLPNIEATMARTTSGLMKSDHYGGGTANMEFQSYSGLPFYNYNSSISSVYLDIAPRMSKFPSISDLFSADQRIAIHPYYSTSYNRNLIYKQLNFAKFMTLDSPDNPLLVTDLDYVGNFISDQATYQMVLNQLDGSGHQFISAMTMQNHVQWLSEEPATITAFGDGFTEQENLDLTSYVRLLSYTDQATKNFLDELQRRPEKISVVFYGDHLPGLYPESAFASDPSLQYKTDYFIWSNFETQTYHYDLVNSSDFPALLLETTSSQVTPYYALLTEVLHKASVDKSEVDKTVQQDLKLVQYDLTTGEGYLMDHPDFFEKIATEEN